MSAGAKWHVGTFAGNGPDDLFAAMPVIVDAHCPPDSVYLFTEHDEGGKRIVVGVVAWRRMRWTMGDAFELFAARLRELTADRLGTMR